MRIKTRWWGGVKIATNKFVLLLSFLLLFTAVSALADVSIVDANDVALNNITAEIDYSQFDDENDETINKTITLRINNTNAQDETVQVTVTGLPADYSFRTSAAQVLVPAGQTQTLDLTVSAPHEQDAGKIKIGTIQVKQNNNVLDQVELIQDTKSMFRLDELKIEYKTDEDDSQSEDACDEGTFCEAKGTPTTYDLEEKVKIGTTVQLTFKIENLFNKDYNDGDLEDIQITIESDDSGLYTDEFDEEFDNLEDITADEKKTYEFEFDVDPEADEDVYTLNIKIEAEDSNGAKYLLEREIDLDTIREKDDIRIQQAQLQPTTVSSCNPSFSLSTELENFGSKKQNFASLKIKSDSLKIDQEEKNIELEEFDGGDSTFEKTFTYNIPSNLKAGEYKIDLTAYVRTGELSDQKQVELKVEECDGQETQEEEEPEVAPSTPQNQTTQNRSGTVVTTSTLPPTQAQQPVTQPNANPSYQVPRTLEDPYTVEDLFIAGIVIAVVLIITLIVVFFVLLLRR
ncbi:hypothetical protein HYV86_03965 [Candidatus Woesearchaeota archaeon]|nr:hypothetical protein [Candidatus Woesearchaeota archaeon]